MELGRYPASMGTQHDRDTEVGQISDHTEWPLMGQSSLYAGDQNRRIFLRSAKPVAARVEREHHRLLRQYFPKGTDLSVRTQAYLNKLARQFNERPRETLQFETQQRDLTPVLRRPVEPAAKKRTHAMQVRHAHQR